MIDNKKGYFLIVDSYPETNEDTIQQNMKELNITRERARFIKLLDWNYPLYFAKRYYIEKAIEKKTTFLKSVLDFIINWIKENFA